MKRALALLLLAACGHARPPGQPPEPLGIRVGITPLAEARVLIEKLGFHCQDASFEALKQAAEAAGMPPGHLNAEAPHLTDARVSCAEIPLGALGDGRDAPTGVTARLLLVAPSADAPISALAVQRTHHDPDVAADDARATFAVLERRLGKPAGSRGAVPAAGARLAQVTPVERDWRVGGIAVTATAVDLGPTGISVSEQISKENLPE